MAARAASLGPYADPLATPEGLLERWNRLRAEDASHAGPAWPAQAGWCKDCTPDNCGGCTTHGVTPNADLWNPNLIAAA